MMKSVRERGRPCYEKRSAQIRKYIFCCTALFLGRGSRLAKQGRKGKGKDGKLDS